ncbi:hypothetical protein GCM10010387_58810 [Streptomyces inusitatus]|uniref:Uncharacterized protein n=1 Tax=Streptomyces inusitatus TaxID=68221 RepID=A0A918QP23_9ACTN|nr:hypothetical protein GCM10010387_58810 [Streptomyces inusitatus]
MADSLAVLVAANPASVPAASAAVVRAAIKGLRELTSSLRVGETGLLKQELGGDGRRPDGRRDWSRPMKD